MEIALTTPELTDRVNEKLETPTVMSTGFHAIKYSGLQAGASGRLMPMGDCLWLKTYGGHVLDLPRPAASFRFAAGVIEAADMLR